MRSPLNSVLLWLAMQIPMTGPRGDNGGVGWLGSVGLADGEPLADNQPLSRRYGLSGTPGKDWRGVTFKSSIPI
ncbi:MAG: hypothetical protein CVV10_05130 [Gammaproteobacteria bacterium HGW-Gammaproteobacteria-14]|nr:MAG: hypothetical protein CVV10_05130 [Gammaproteobacteria bacterium HGW-Gammaproteobacteria-14]